MLTAAASVAVRAEEPAQVTPLAVGAAMEDFGLREVNVASGKLERIVWLSDFVGPDAAGRPRKKLLLLSFFASWCKPCVAELPLLGQLQARYAALGLQVVSVHVRAQDETFEAALAATRQVLPATGLGFPMLFDRYTNRAQLVYLGARASLPCNVLIDQRGTIAARASGAQGLEALVRAQLGLRGVR